MEVNRLGGKSMRRSWSAESIEKQLKKAEKKEGKSLLDVFGGDNNDRPKSQKTVQPDRKEPE